VSAATYGTYGASPTRRTKAEIEAIKAAILEALLDQHPATVRGLFYQLVSRGVIAKTEGEYRSTVCRLTADMRRHGELPYAWLADNTRWMRKSRSWSSLEDALAETAEFYRRALWAEQDAYVEVWLEKDALAGVILDVTCEYDVPLMVTRGYASLSFLYSAAEAIAAQDKPVFLYYLGDHDPSGVDIPRKVEAELRRLAPGADLFFSRLAVLPEQIVDLDLPTRPTKKTDSRSKRFVGESVEVDAIPPRKLRDVVKRAIERHIDFERLEALEEIEAQERATLSGIAERWQP